MRFHLGHAFIPQFLDTVHGQVVEAEINGAGPLPLGGSQWIGDRTVRICSSMRSQNCSPQAEGISGENFWVGYHILEHNFGTKKSVFVAWLAKNPSCAAFKARPEF